MLNLRGLGLVLNKMYAFHLSTEDTPIPHIFLIMLLLAQADEVQTFQTQP